MKNLFLILVAMCAVACGGESFETAEFDAVAGEAPVTAGAGGSTAMGGSTAGGRPATAGAPASAGTANGGASAGAAAGGSGGYSQCDLDPTLIANMLPKQIVWRDAMFTNGETCVQCRDATCITFNVVSWGIPVDNGDGTYGFSPNADHPMIPLSVGTNDGMCTQDHVCGVKVYDLGVSVTVKQVGGSWVISDAKLHLSFQDNQACPWSSPLLSDDLSQEFSKSVNGLKIPCDE